MKNFLIAVLWKNKNWNSFDFVQDGYDLLIIFFEFLLAKNCNFKDSVFLVLLKSSPVMYPDKLMMLNVKTDKPTMKITFDIAGSQNFIASFVRLFSCKSEVFNCQDEEFHASVKICCKKSKYLTYPTEYNCIVSNF